jgi:hypothetical protein
VVYEFQQYFTKISSIKKMKEYIEKALEYAEYIKLIDDLLLEGKTTGTNQSEAMFNYGKINRQRMKRLGVTVEIKESLAEIAQNVGQKWIWLIITEGWCGDAAQNIPIIEKIAHLNSNIETRYILRDENLELMDKYLTNNARSIPKLICLDAETLEEIGTWGPRPNIAMNYFYEMRESGMEKTQMMENMQRWYITDKEQSIQHEFAELLTNWGNVQSRNATAK